MKKCIYIMLIISLLWIFSSCGWDIEIRNPEDNPPESIAGMKVLSVSDYKKSEKICKVTGEKTVIDLPSSNVLCFELEKSCYVIVRPSGTEPKIKIYFTACAENREKAQAIKDIMSAEMKKYME